MFNQKFFMNCTGETDVILAESWVYIADPSKVPEVGAVVHIPNGKNVIVLLYIWV